MKLTDPEISTLLADLSGWAIESGQLAKTFTFSGYLPAVMFVNAAAFLAEKADHHPELLLTWGKVRVSTWTHDADGITAKDFALARAIDGL